MLRYKKELLCKLDIIYQSNLFKLLNTNLLDIGVLYLCRHPGRCASGLSNLLSLYGEYVHFLCSPSLSR